MGGGVTGGRRRVRLHRSRAKSKCINNVGLPKLHSRQPMQAPQRPPRPAGAEEAADVAAEPGSRCDSGAQGSARSLPLPPPPPPPPPQMFPPRRRRNNMSAKDGHVLLVMSTRGGGKSRHGVFQSSLRRRRISPRKSHRVAADTKHASSNLAEAFNRARRCRRAAGADKVHAARQVKIFSGFPECGYWGASLKAGRGGSGNKLDVVRS